MSADNYTAAQLDAKACFGSTKDSSHQERCHAYCREVLPELRGEGGRG